MLQADAKRLRQAWWGWTRQKTSRGVVQIRVTPKARNPFTIKALSISGVTWNWHVLNHAPHHRLAGSGRAAVVSHVPIVRARGLGLHRFVERSNDCALDRGRDPSCLEFDINLY